MKFKVFEQLWFATPIWECQVQDIDIQSIHKYCLHAQSTSSGTVISNRGGWHSSEISLPVPEALKELFTDAEAFANEVCVKHTGVKNLKIGNFWININGPGDYNILHDHQKSILSGVFYVDVPEVGMGDLILHRGDTAEYFLTSNVERVETTSNSFVAVKHPVTGTMYIFPSWVKHRVEANKSDKKRISIAFNLVV